jgi:hypothetical protein
MIRNVSFCMVVLSFGLLALPGCPGFFVGCDEGPCGSDGGLDGTLPDGEVRDTNTPDVKPDADPIPTDCTTPTDPTKNPEKCLVDSFGVFVSPTGDDTKDGSKANPFKTIGKALSTSRSRIVVCEGEYAGSLDVGRAVEIYGGVACDFAKAGAKAKIVASKPAYGIKISKVAAAVILADLDIVGMNAAAPSESSVGVFASESADVKVLRSRVEAGDGADAPAKKDGAFAMAAQAPKGGDAVANTGGASATSGVCPGGGTSVGGKGGDLGAQGDDGNPRPPGGAKGAVALCNAGGGGNDGNAGTSGMDRAGAVSMVSIAPTGISGSKGQDGAAGSIGGGGGGGYGTGGAGGAGGAGGCGGQGGIGGAAGGSSVALLVFASEVSLEGTELLAKNAKPGGAGGSGQAGQAGGFGGNKSGGACGGGNGAVGGSGGNAGGGAGGIAAGIVWSTGKEPKRDGATKITRPTAAAPTGGEGGGGAATKGIDGIHADVLEVK